MAEAMERASPARAISERPLLYTSLAAFAGATLGVSRAARTGLGMFGNLMLLSSGRIFARTLDVVDRIRQRRKTD